MKLILHITFIFSLSSLSFLYGQSAADYGFIEGVNFKDNVTYKSGLVMDIFYPDSDKMQEKNPWVVFVHGGGWAGGNMDDIYKTAFIGPLQKLVENGVVVATIKYRRARDGDTSYESVVDCKDAARFLLKNAELYKLHEEDYGIWGGSAGGHLSLVTALVPDSNFPGEAGLSDINPMYKCITSFYPFTSCLNADLRPGSIFADSTLFTRLLGGTLEEKPELALLLSPTEFLEETSPPILLVHGNNDTTLPIINSEYMVEVAEDKNADVELLTVVNGGHSFSGNNISPSIAEIADYTTNFFLSHFSKSLSTDNVNKSLSELSLYPNPLSDVLNIDNADGATLEIYNVVGKLVLKKEIVGANQTIDLNNLKTGLYITKIKGNNKIITSKIIKQTKRY
ncbi:MAG: T9SS type A sorting domain-containing protein [Algibacter sp.]